MWIQKIPAGVLEMTFSADGQVLYILDSRGAITAWHIAAKTQQPVHRIARLVHPELALSTACDGRFLVVRLPAFVLIWDIATGAEHAQFRRESNSYPPILDPTRRLLVVPDSQRELLTTWDIAERKPGPPLLHAESHFDRFGVFALTADENTVAVHTSRREVVLYDRTAGRSFVRFPTIPAVGPVMQLAFSFDGKTLALLGVDRVTLWDVPSQSVRAGRVWCSMPIHVSAVHPTLPIIAARNSSGHITLFSLETGETIRSLDFAVGKSTVRCVCFSPDGLTCAVGGSNKQFAIFDVDV